MRMREVMKMEIIFLLEKFISWSDSFDTQNNNQDQNKDDEDAVELAGASRGSDESKSETC
jgi:hypothetical protein